MLYYLSKWLASYIYRFLEKIVNSHFSIRACIIFFQTRAIFCVKFSTIYKSSGKELRRISKYIMRERVISNNLLSMGNSSKNWLFKVNDFRYFVPFHRETGWDSKDASFLSQIRSLENRKGGVCLWWPLNVKNISLGTRREKCVV